MDLDLKPLIEVLATDKLDEEQLQSLSQPTYCSSYPRSIAKQKSYTAGLK
jgi:hypothetical protein